MILIDRGIHDDSLMYFQNFNFVNIKIENSVRSGTTVGGERWKLVGGGVVCESSSIIFKPSIKIASKLLLLSAGLKAMGIFSLLS